MFRFWLMWLALQTGHDWNELANDAAIAMDFPELQTTGSNSEGPSENSIEGQTCPELGTQLEYFDPTLFHHITRTPQCGHEIKPKLTLFTRTETHGCILTENPSPGTIYNIPMQCHSAITGLKKIVFIVHGFALSPDQLDEFLDMKTEILRLEDVGVIVVDWYKGAHLDLSFLKNATLSTIMRDFVNLDFYHQAAANTRYIGAALALVADNLRTLFVQQSRTPFMHCIGHSLGAHVCGFLGKALKKISATPLDRITGLDPAGPLFLESGIISGLPSYSDDSHLCAVDATLVDTIHTDSTWLGSFTKTGDLDFYVGESKTNEVSAEKVDKFGYDQPGVENCFMESHHRAIDIFAATIQDNTCTAEKLCNNIHLNATYDCHPTEDIKFGYKIETGQSLRGSIPIDSNTNSIKCSQMSPLNVTSHLPASGFMKVIAKINFCSLVRSIQGPIRELVETIHHLHQKSRERIASTQKAVRGELDRLLSSPEAASASIEVLAVFKDMQELEILQEREINKLNALARRTQRVSRKMVSALKEIIDHGTGSVNIEYIVKQVRNLLNYSNEKLDTAEKTLDEIARKWGSVEDKLKVLSSTIGKEQKNIEDYKAKMNKQTELTKQEMGTITDWLKGVGSVAWVGVKLYSNGLTDVADDVLGASLAILWELYERWEEEKTIEVFEEVVKEAEKLIDQFKNRMKEIATARITVKKKKEEIKARKIILENWQELVQYIIDEYGQDDYKNLEKEMLSRNKYRLNEALEDFKELEEVATKFLDYSDQ